MTNEATPEQPRGPGVPPLDPKLLEILVCPLTKTSLVYVPEKQELVSRAARLAFPIRDGVAVMLEDEARVLDDQELRGLAKR